MDDVAHDRGVVQVFNCVFGSPGAGEENASQAQVLTGLRMKQDLHFFHLAKLGAHVQQERFFDVIIQSGKRHLFQWNWTHVVLIQLMGTRKKHLRRGG